MANTDRSTDLATIEMLDKAAADGVTTAFDRAAAMKPCPIGGEGSCCKLCSMGPCRLPAPRNRAETAEEREKRRGICGATIETVAARNFVRMIAGGTAAHSDHGRAVAQTFLATARGENENFQIADEQKLLQVALDFGIEIGDRSIQEIAIAVGEAAVAEFGKAEGTLRFLQRAPLKRQQLWKEQQVEPRSIDREVVEAMHRTLMGVDMDYEHLFQQGTRTALADGWGGSMLATELQDIMLGTPVPIAGKVNLGILKEDCVNIIVHGHEPLLPEMLVIASQDQELIALAKTKGAAGINLGGICCSANEMLMRHGIPLAGNMLQQELAVVSGAVEAIVVDVQCVMQSLPKVAECYHTAVITTSSRAKIPGALHLEFDEAHPLETAVQIVRVAIDRFPERVQGMVNIPTHSMDLVAGFSHETINYLLGGIFRASYRPLNENIINGRIRGVAGVVGCSNPRVKHDDVHATLVRELIKNDVLVIQTGCAAMACAKLGLMTPEAASLHAGPGLAEVCEAVGIPPVLHMGSCVDNSRILMAATAMVKEGGLGDDLSDLPVAGAAPEWMSEKAIAIGQYFVASGVFTVFGVSWPTLGSEEVTRWLFDGIGGIYGGKWAFEPDPLKMAKLMIDHIDQKRKVLGLDKARERVLFDMEMRRELEAV
ncbi:MAG: anaerobic carbon-monoxide dehydrogenase catalytic subunit [Candidatus Latescibacteria bacterium]|nr:anaerobic carbon-monoxide dehydrogenase catalytic subunit [Candidatus Latescibacterota bacterium]